MEINAQQTIPQVTDPQVNVLTQDSTNNQGNNKTEETIDSSNSTLQLSDTSLTLSANTTKSSTEVSPSPRIDNEVLAQQSVEKFQKDSANNPTLTQNAHANNATSELIANLIG